MKYDAIVIGSGQAGNPLSFRLADLGWRVALIEKANLGGTCINTGCTPTKTMVHRAQVAYYARNAARWGVNAQNVSVDLRTVVTQKDKVVHAFRDGTQKKIEKRQNLNLYKGQARFVNAHQVRVSQTGAEDVLLESDKIFINTGGRPRIPRVPGLDSIKFLTNENIMDLTVLPDHLIVLGGGYVGLEFGQMFRRFGSRVTIIHNTNQIVPHEDPEVSAELQRVLGGGGNDVPPECADSPRGARQEIRSEFLSTAWMGQRRLRRPISWWPSVASQTRKTLNWKMPESRRTNSGSSK